jgi:hypothetical protein
MKRSTGFLDSSCSARFDRFVVIAEDLGEHVLFLGFDHRFLPVRPRPALLRAPS